MRKSQRNLVLVLVGALALVAAYSILSVMSASDVAPAELSDTLVLEQDFGAQPAVEAAEADGWGATASIAAGTFSVQTFEPATALVMTAKTSQADKTRDLTGVFTTAMDTLSDVEIAPVGAPFAVYDTLEIEAGSFGLTAGFPVPSGTQPRKKLQAGTLPGGKAAVTVHVGPYEKLPEAHRALREWMTQQGHEPSGPPWEVYLDNPRTTLAEELTTRVCYPVD